MLTAGAACAAWKYFGYYHHFRRITFTAKHKAYPPRGDLPAVERRQMCDKATEGTTYRGWRLLVVSCITVAWFPL